MRALHLTAVLVLVVVNGTPYEDCGSSPGVLLSVDVSGCDRDSVCGIKRGQEAAINITFIPVKTLGRVNVELYAIINGIPLQFPDPSIIADGCQDSTMECPAAGGQIHKYFKKVGVSRLFPKLTFEMKWVLKDENNVVFICIKILSRLE